MPITKEPKNEPINYKTTAVEKFPLSNELKPFESIKTISLIKSLKQVGCGMYSDKYEIRLSRGKWATPFLLYATLPPDSTIYTITEDENTRNYSIPRTQREYILNVKNPKHETLFQLYSDNQPNCCSGEVGLIVKHLPTNAELAQIRTEYGLCNSITYIYLHGLTIGTLQQHSSCICCCSAEVKTTILSHNTEKPTPRAEMTSSVVPGHAQMASTIDFFDAKSGEEKFVLLIALAYRLITGYRGDSRKQI